MSDNVTLALIGGFQTVALAVIAAWLKHGQEDAKQAQIDNHLETKAAIESVHKEVNGQTEKLLQVSGDARQALGNLQGRAEEKAESEQR